MATPTERDVSYIQEPDDHRMTEPLDMDQDGIDETVIAQDAVGAENTIGGGEFPDPNRPAQAPAPGSVEQDEERER